MFAHSQYFMVELIFWFDIFKNNVTLPCCQNFPVADIQDDYFLVNGGVNLIMG